MTRTVSFLVVDDHPIFRQGLVALLKATPGYEICAEAGTVDEALRSLEEWRPDVALVDISLGSSDGLDLVKTISASYPNVSVLVISMHDESIYAARALKAGALGYVMKQEAASVLIEAVISVLGGRIYVSDTIRDRLLHSMLNKNQDAPISAIDRLSDRELEVLRRIGEGYGAAEIAGLLNLSVKTVNVYRDHLKRKLQFETSAELRRFAVSWYQSTNR